MHRLPEGYGITTYSTPMPTTAPSYNCIPSFELTYNKAKDCYTWPSGEFKKRIGNSTTSGHYRAFIYRTQASG